MLSADPARLYSWWWNTHISPKNSKWLQENLRDMDAKIKAMIILIEDDADSFARRAEMYYKRRPELMKLVEEFYRAYRALAERYDHATSELRQAHRTMAEAFPNQIPFNLSEDSPTGSYAADGEPNTIDATLPMRLLSDPDNSENISRESSLLTDVKRNGGFPEEKNGITNKKRLKQINEMFPSSPSSDKKTLRCGGKTEIGNFNGALRRVPTIQEDAEKGSEESERTVALGLKNKVEVKDKGTQYEGSDVESEILENLNKIRSEMYDLKMALIKLQEEHKAAIFVNQQTLEQHKNSLKRIADLETQVCLGHEEVRRLNQEIFKGIVNTSNAEDRTIRLDIENKSIQSEMDNMVQKFTLQQEERLRDHKELQQVRLCMQEEHMQSMSSESTLQSLGQLYSELKEQHTLLVLELRHGMHLLKDREHRNHTLEDEVVRLKEENNRLNTQNMSDTVSIKNVQDEIFILKEVIRKLQEEVELRTDERNDLQKELYCLKEERNDLNGRYTTIVARIESVGLDPECLQSSIKELQDENVILKESCNRKDNEKEILRQDLKNMENAMENYKLLKSLLDKNSELEHLKENFKIVENSCRFLVEDKTTLSNEQDGLLAKLDTMMQSQQLLEAMNTVAKEKHFYLQKEKELIVNQLEELQICLKLVREERESIVESSSSQLDDLESEISVLLEKDESMKTALEERGHQILASQIEMSVSYCVIVDMFRMIRNLAIECDKYIDRISNANRLATELEQKRQEKRRKLESALEKPSSTAGKSLNLRSFVQRLVELLNLDLDVGYFDTTEIEVIVQKNRSRIDAMASALLTAKNENEHMQLEIIIMATILEQVGAELSGLLLKKNKLEMEIVSQAEKLKHLQNEKHGCEQLVERLRQKLLSLEDREKCIGAEISMVRKQLSDAQELCQSSENKNHKLYEENISFATDIVGLNGQRCALEENNDNLSEALWLGNLALIFERPSTEKTVEIKRFNGALIYLDGINITLEKQAGEMIEKLSVLKTENLHFKSSIEKLEEYKKTSMLFQNEVDIFRIKCRKLNQQIEIEQELLNEKETKMSEAEQKLAEMQSENAEVTKERECVKKEVCEAVALQKALQKDVMEFTTEVTKKSKEIDHMTVEWENLKSSFKGSNKKIHELKCQEDYLENGLKEKEYGMEFLHIDCMTLCHDVQVSAIHVVVLEQKVQELISVCKSLEEKIQIQKDKFLHAESLKQAEIQELKRTNALLEEENQKLKLESFGYASFISSLKQTVVSLENRCLALKKTKSTSLEDDESCNCNDQDKAHELHKHKGSRERDTLNDLHTLQAKIQAMGDSVQIFENIKKEYRETELMKEALEMEINVLVKEINDRGNEMRSILEGKDKLELMCDELLEEICQSHFREEYLKSELRSSIEEVEFWQISLEKVYRDLQSGTIYGVTINQKWHELVKECQNLEIKSQLHAQKLLDHITLRDSEVAELKREVVRLESLNEKMSLGSKENASLLSCIKESVCSLEERCLVALGTRASGVPERSGADSSTQWEITSMVDSKCSPQHAGTEEEILQLHELFNKLKTVENMVIDLTELMNDNKVRGSGDHRSVETEIHACEDASIELKDDKFGDGSVPNAREPHKTKNVLTKGVQLDHVSDSTSSSSTNVVGSFGKMPRGNVEADAQMLELWEAAERYFSHEPEISGSMISRAQHSSANVKSPTKKMNKNNDHSFSESHVEREVTVDKMEISSENDNNQRIREVLAWEAHRLMDLQNNVQDLSRRFGRLGKSLHPNKSDVGNVKERLGKVEAIVLLLVEANHELLGRGRPVLGGTLDGKSEILTSEKLEDRPEMMEETGKRLQKIEQLELELQRIEFMLRKWEDVEVKENRAEIQKLAEKTLLLRDYLYGVMPRRHRKKKRLCGCVRPTTEAD